MLDARFSHLYFYQSLNRLQRGLSAIAELLVQFDFLGQTDAQTDTGTDAAKTIPALHSGARVA